MTSAPEQAQPHTKDLLAEALAEAGLPDMAARAREGYYHDFLSPLASPALQLAEDLRAAGTPAARALRERHLEGKFDASDDEANEWAASIEGQEIFGQFPPSRDRDR
jgi:hypothetical protein